MKLDQISFEGGCCAGSGYAEVEVNGGWLALMKNHEDGSIKVRRFGADKMPLGGFEEMTPDQVESLL